MCNRFRYCRGPWNGAYTARYSPGQPHMIVVIDKKLLKFERGHRATRWCNIVGIIQLIYGTVHVPDCHVRSWNVVYTARDSPGQSRAIVVVHKKRLKFERGHRATRQCDITYIQRIYDTCKYHGPHIGHFGRFSIFYSPGRVTAPYIRSIPI